MTSLISQRKMSKNSNLKSLSEVNKTQSCQLDPFLDPEGQSDPFEPRSWAQNRLEHKKRVGFGRTYVVIVNKFTDLSLTRSCEEMQSCYYVVVYFLMLTSTYLSLSYLSALDLYVQFDFYQLQQAEKSSSNKEKNQAHQTQDLKLQNIKIKVLMNSGLEKTT